MSYTTITNTYSSTKIAILLLYVRSLLRKTTNISEELLTDAIEKGISNRWIKQINVYAISSNNLCKAQISLRLDWDDFNLFVSNNRAILSTVDTLRTPPPEDFIELVHLFSNYVIENS